MNTKPALSNTRSFIRAHVASYVCLTTVAACALFLGPTQAKAKEVTVAFSVSAAGLDVSQPAGARELYRGLQNAARIVCTNGMRVDLSLRAAFQSATKRHSVRPFVPRTGRS